ncbi:MAG: asparagine synthase (glutamine-hydrolyzing) [Chitinophagales bacterium]|nr:asparagine synthase (glutamine-hydrolyzing) [Bacteroidota bacterium]MCB9255504.1 asparagine synthase (glutamine-hydrolyzing) [Chitinophagales bacterium]
MCGIAGFLSFDKTEFASDVQGLNAAITKLNLRGPDFQGYSLYNEKLGFAHARLSIIDTSDASNQPMSAYNNSLHLIFNGEIYNYRELRDGLITKFGEQFQTQSDTEVILRMYKHYGVECVSHFNGFFAFAIYDEASDQVFIARDRMGIKPLFFAQKAKQFYFASELKALLEFNIPRQIDFVSLQQYFQFNYIPQPNSILQGVKKLAPGAYLLISNKGEITQKSYYKIPFQKKYSNLSYTEAQVELKRILELSVQRRLVSDVPLGSFLSGGIDSSVIATLAARHQTNLNTFSIGFTDNPYFDETKYANLVAKRIKSNHTVFSLSNQDLYDNLHNILDYIDEPFADSSAIPVYILSRKTREKVTVALSGDGADEMFGGYNKHMAEFKMLEGGFASAAVKAGLPLWKLLPKSRHSKFSNLFRQLERYAEGAKMEAKERYWRWCSFTPESYPKDLIKFDLNTLSNTYESRKQEILQHFTSTKDINETLRSDMDLVLVNDMLTKVDLMSMANSLEVRVPFLDHELVNFAFQLPGHYKVSHQGRKRILKDAFRNELPSELYTRNKMGFEVPLLQWFRSDLKALILDDLLADNFIVEQNLFNLSAVQNLKRTLFSNNPGEVHAQIWALIVFQVWYKKYIM